MTPGTARRWTDEFWTVPRVAAFGVFLLAIGVFIFLQHYSGTGPEYGPAQDRLTALAAASYVYDVVEAGPQRTGLPVPVARTVDLMQADYRGDAVAARVTVHGTHIMVTFPQRIDVCVWVPVIVEGPKEPRIVHC